MTRDEAKRLLGGYATGSLSEAERKALFEAAVDDQELFEELAGEQDLKEILALPGAKQRLAAALTSVGPMTTTNAPEEKKKRAWWLFALAGVAGVGLVVWLLMPVKTDGPVEVATAEKTQAPADLPDSSTLTSPAINEVVRSERDKEHTAFERDKSKAAASKSERKSTADTTSEKVTGGKGGSGKADKAIAASAGATTVGAPTAAAPNAPSSTERAAVGGDAVQPPGVPVPAPARQVAQGFIAGGNGADATQPRLEAQAGGAGKGGAKGKAATVRPDAAPVRAGNLTYVLTGRGSLKVTAAVSGSLEVTAGDRVIIGWDPVVADSTVEMPVPSATDALTLRFRVPGQQEAVVNIPIRQ